MEDFTTWNKPLFVKGRLRMNFDMWQIPNKIRNGLNLQNGKEYAIQVNAGAAVLFIGLLKTTSGHELYLTMPLQKKLRDIISRPPTIEHLTFRLLTESELIDGQLCPPPAMVNGDNERLRLEERLKSAPKKPTKRIVQVVVYYRNYDVVKWVLDRAAGVCESCKSPAPFERRTDKTPYLEVHHRIQLADDGDDTVENAIAMCPNCHRQAHYG